VRPLLWFSSTPIPLQDIRNPQRVWAVLAGGKLFECSDLDALLREGN
jgi:hypothetical protein